MKPSRFDDGADVTSFSCPHCMLAFEIGSYGYWDSPGRCTQVVCGACGTMHRVEQSNAMARLFAQPKPIERLVDFTFASVDGRSLTCRLLPLETWIEVGEISPAPDVGGDFRKREHREWLRQLRCHACATVGRLVIALAVTDEAEGFQKHCPRCSARLDFVGVKTVN